MDELASRFAKVAAERQYAESNSRREREFSSIPIDIEATATFAFAFWDRKANKERPRIKSRV